MCVHCPVKSRCPRSLAFDTLTNIMQRVQYEIVIMAMLTVRKLPDEVHRALHLRAVRSSRSMIVATHNTAPFEAAHLKIIDPWEA